MSYLITAPTAEEIAPLIGYIKKQPGEFPVDILITGVGLTNTVYHLAKQIQLKRPAVMIQAGVAGCFDREINLGEVLTVKQDTIADAGVMEDNKFQTLFDLGLEARNRFPYNKGWLRNSNTSLLKQTGWQGVTGITVNQVTTGKEMIRTLEDKFAPVTESLEGAGFHYVGIMEKIPFVQVRSISNYIGERDKKKWKLKTAIGYLNDELIRFLESI